MPFDSFFSSTTKQRIRPLSDNAREAFDKATEKDLKKPAIRAPKRRFDPLSEEQRHQAAIARLNAF